MKSWLLAFVAITVASAALAASPPAPSITVAATDIKQLQFDITPVTRANWYELWFRANDGAQWVKYAETPAQKPRIRAAVAVHLLDWRQARYYVNACNPGGCTASAEVGVDGEQLAAMGYFKPNAPDGVRYYGSQVALSADGRTLAVLSGDTIGPADGSAAVSVYRRTTATSGWRFETRLVPNVVQAFTARYFNGDQVAISGDGNLIALGTPDENITGPYPVTASGAVYLFRRSGSTWQQSQRIAGALRTNDHFGYSVKVDDAGRTLAISHDTLTRSSEHGTIEIYRADSFGGPFAPSATVPVIFDDPTRQFCDSIELSGDGQTLFRGCKYSPTGPYIQVLTGSAWAESARVQGFWADGLSSSYDGKRFVTQNYGTAEVYGLEAGGWAHQVQLPGWGSTENGHRYVAISRDGKVIAIGNTSSDIAGLGPIYQPYELSDYDSGHVVVYDRRSEGRWFLRRLIKPGSTNRQNFGNSVALGDNGRVLAVGAQADASRASGIDGDRDDYGAPARGAVWLY